MTFQTRLIQEQKSLKSKIDSIESFVGSGKFLGLPLEDRLNLIEQRHYMDEYNRVLLLRIERLPELKSSIAVTWVEGQRFKFEGGGYAFLFGGFSACKEGVIYLDVLDLSLGEGWHYYAIAKKYQSDFLRAYAVAVEASL